MKALKEEKMLSFPAQLHLDDIARFEFFLRASGRQAGVWVVRHGPVHFALPFTTGPVAGISDYLPTLHGLPGFAVPVEKISPCLVPFFELEDGTVLVASDGADKIHASADGNRVTAIWRRWAIPGGRPDRQRTRELRQR